MKHKIPYYTSIGTLLLAFAMCIWVLLLAFLPTTYWFEYFSVEPAQSQFDLGEKPVILSDNTVYQTVQMNWNDVMRCDFDDGYGYGYFSQYESSATHHKHERKISRWIYQAQVPEVPATCIIDSTITINLPLGFTKEQKLQSGPFTYE